MQVQLHVQHPDQDDVQESADSDQPPEDSWNSRRDIGKPGPPQLDKVIELAQGLGVDDFLAFFRRLSKILARCLVF